MRLIVLLLILVVACAVVDGWPIYHEFKNGYVITDNDNNYCYFQPYKTREPKFENDLKASPDLKLLGNIRSHGDIGFGPNTVEMPAPGFEHLVSGANTVITSSHAFSVEEPKTILTVSEDYKTVEYDPKEVTVRPLGGGTGYYLAGELREETYCGDAVPFFRVTCPDGRETVTRALALYSNDGTYQGDLLVLVSEKQTSAKPPPTRDLVCLGEWLGHDWKYNDTSGWQPRVMCRTCRRCGYHEDSIRHERLWQNWVEGVRWWSIPEKERP